MPFQASQRPPASASGLARHRDRHAFLAVLLQLVAEGPYRNAEDVRRVGPVAETVLQRLDDEIALDLRDRLADQAAGYRGCRGRRSVVGGRLPAGRIEHDVVGLDFVPLRT